MATILAVSDLHGHLPAIPECDILLIGGDICPYSQVSLQAGWLQDAFKHWLEGVPAREVVAVAGNHDWVFARAPHLVPDLRWHYLEDRGVELFGLRIYGTPWQPRFHNWAFNLDEPELEVKFNGIPAGTDIVVSHSAPFGFGDLASGPSGSQHVGSRSLRKRLVEIQPRLSVFGHVHEGRGVYRHGGMVLANVTVVNRTYEMVHAPMLFTLEPIWGPTGGSVSPPRPRS